MSMSMMIVMRLVVYKYLYHKNGLTVKDSLFDDLFFWFLYVIIFVSNKEQQTIKLRYM